VQCNQTGVQVQFGFFIALYTLLRGLGIMAVDAIFAQRISLVFKMRSFYTPHYAYCLSVRPFVCLPHGRFLMSLSTMDCYYAT